jgi:hypothetical protein
MTSIKSEKVLINAPVQRVFEFLCNFNNYQQLMPEQVTDWQSDDDSGSFTIKNMATIGLRIIDKVPFEKVHLEKTKAPFELTLDCIMNDMGDNFSTQLELQLDAELNAMLKMMATKPLTNFVNILATNCKKVLEGS